MAIENTPPTYAKHDPRITVLRRDNLREYSRQLCYIRRNPFCREVPAKGPSYRINHARAGGRKADPRITVKPKENRKEYDRQRAYIKKNPDCKKVPSLSAEREFISARQSLREILNRPPLY